MQGASGEVLDSPEPSALRWYPKCAKRVSFRCTQGSAGKWLTDRPQNHLEKVFSRCELVAQISGISRVAHTIDASRPLYVSKIQNLDRIFFTSWRGRPALVSRGRPNLVRLSRHSSLDGYRGASGRPDQRHSPWRRRSHACHEPGHARSGRAVEILRFAPAA